MDSNLIHEEYSKLAKVLNSASHKDCKQLVFEAVVLGKNCYGIETYCNCSPDLKLFLDIDMQACFEVDAAAVRIRDECLRTTGDRIWGLTFTLYPDGKYKIDYDYNRPEWYTEEVELGDEASAKAAKEESDAASLAMRLNSLGAEVELIGGLALHSNAFLNESLTWLRERTAQLEQDCGLGSESNWNLDLNTGVFTLSFQDGHTIDFGVQIVGTYNTIDSTLMWGWDHPSVPTPLRQASETLRQFLVKNHLDELTPKTITCSEMDAWVLTAAAARLAQAQGAYRGRAGDTWVYMTLFNLLR